ncbi:MAG: tetratricopeptide repeat protein [Candidatus Eremiobacteraeota bacterium]|nr:tetratricopeptide repeat protein [Candidatus Eremiobacteraeota bacterium]
MNKRNFIAALLLTGLVGSFAPAWSEDETPPLEAQKALAEGRELYRKGFSESAIVQYRKSIELDPDNAQAYEELGKILTETKNNAYAITIYNKLADLQPDNLKWREILFELHTAYEMPREAAADGEILLAARPNDLELIKRLAEVYKGYGLSDKYADTLVRGARLNNDARMYYDAGEAYLAADLKPQAVDAYGRAAEIEPTNLEYQNAYGKGLNAIGDSEAARAHYDKVAQQFPQAQGLKDRQAETELAVGDRMLTARRFVAARQAYEKAKALNGGAADTGLGASIDERIAKAERLNHVYLENPIYFGKQGTNHFVENLTYIGIPLHDEDVSFQIINDYRFARAPGQGQSDFASQQLGVDWKASEFTNVYARAGTFGIFQAGVNHQDDRFTGGVQLRRDIVTYTPQGIRDRLSYIGGNVNAAYQFNDWFSLGGAFSAYHYSDDIFEYTYNIGPRLTPINKPNDFIWGIGYNHGGVFNQRDANDLQRFGPTNFQIDSFGTDIEHWISRDFRYRLGYYRSLSNVGVNGNTFLGGFDWQINEGSYAWLNGEYGNFFGGRVQPGLFSTTNSNWLIHGGVHVTF